MYRYAASRIPSITGLYSRFALNRILLSKTAGPLPVSFAESGALFFDPLQRSDGMAVESQAMSPLDVPAAGQAPPPVARSRED